MRALFVALATAGWGLLVWGGIEAAAATPILQLDPPQIATGGTANVSGSGFCGASSCSSVSVKVDQRVVAADIRPASDGTFQRQFTVLEIPGVYMLMASQTAADGTLITASVRLIVGAADSRTPAPPVNSPGAPPISPAWSSGGFGSPAEQRPGTTPTGSVPGAVNPGGSGLLPWMAVGAALILAVLVVGAWWLLRWRRGRP